MHFRQHGFLKTNPLMLYLFSLQRAVLGYTMLSEVFTVVGAEVGLTSATVRVGVPGFFMEN